MIVHSDYVIDEGTTEGVRQRGDAVTTLPCPLCAAPVLPDDATEETIGGPCHAECAANERDFALVNEALR